MMFLWQYVVCVCVCGRGVCACGEGEGGEYCKIVVLYDLPLAPHNLDRWLDYKFVSINSFFSRRSCNL